MALKETISLWDEGVLAYKEGRYEDACGKFEQIPETARIHYNMSCVHLRKNDGEEALKHLANAIKKDPILVIAYYLRGLVLLNSGSPADAMKDFDKCIIWMRGNAVIDYKQLGLLFKLYLCEILYHQAVAYLQLGDRQKALQFIQKAEEKQVEAKHKSSITQALHSLQNSQSDEVKTLPLPITNIFTPPKSLTQNLAKRDYLGKAEVVSSYEASDTSVGFDGAKKIEERRAKTPSPTSGMRGKMATLNVSGGVRESRSMESIAVNGKTKANTLAGPISLQMAFSNHAKIMTAFAISQSESKTPVSSDKPSENKPLENSKLLMPTNGKSPRCPPPSYPPPPLPQIILTGEGK